VTDPLDRREDRALRALRRELDSLDEEIVSALDRALARDPDRLTGGAWGAGDDGCLLTLAAREMGCTHGSDLLPRSVAAVRIPAVFDDLWAIVIERTGDPRTARQIVRHIVSDALDARRATFDRTMDRFGRSGEILPNPPTPVGA
jgi:chorismate mutase